MFKPNLNGSAGDAGGFRADQARKLLQPVRSASTRKNAWQTLSDHVDHDGVPDGQAHSAQATRWARV